ncbi:uncharacterized protein PHACADRAFT_89262, partial [Phanerochaete carnosa HHB-10118-sp]
IVSDSKYTIAASTQHCSHWEDIGWIEVANAHLIRSALYRLRARSTPTTFAWVKGHSGNTGNESADMEAACGALFDGTDKTLLRINLTFDVQRAKLHSLTQSLSYHSLRNFCGHTIRPTTLTCLSDIQLVIDDRTGLLPTTASIWKSLHPCDHDIEHKSRDFLYKGLHNALRIRSFWTNIPRYID